MALMVVSALRRIQVPAPVVGIDRERIAGR
jgi:hypothetical protein